MALPNGSRTSNNINNSGADGETSPLLRGETQSASVHDSEATYIPSPDHGKAAWLFLAGCFVIEGLVWEGVAAVGTTTTGVLYFLSPAAVLALQRWPSHRVLMTALGLGMVVLSLVAASFATSVTDLLFTQGAMYGIGGAFLYNPFVFYLDEWFIERKGLAFGILWAGTGISGTLVPLIMEWGLENYGFRIMLRFWAVVMFAGIAPLMYVTRPRLPTPKEGTTRPLYLGFFRNPTFWIFQAGNVLEGFGYFMPSIYLPSYGSSLGFPPLPCTLAVSILNCASVIGTILIGSLTDFLHITTVILISALGSALSAFVLWGLATSKPVLYLFALVYGVFAGGYAATWAGCLGEVQRDSRDAEAGVVLGMMAATRGIGAVVSGPLSEVLFKFRLGDASLAGAYGTEYGVVILFTGITAVLGGLGAIERVRIWGMDDGEVESIRQIRWTHEDMR
ncbi:MAG: hypothetical protein Q9191_000151 [Dirinaria sp. TL-2023a]